MKKQLFLFIITFASNVLAQIQMQTLPLGERRPDLYYYGSNWPDSNKLQYGNLAEYDGGVLGAYDSYIGRPCITQQPMKVIGVAATVYFTFNAVMDSSSGPEYFQLYQHEGDSIYYKGEARWDTTTPQYRIELPFNSLSGGYESYELYEAYFDKSIIVHDTFYVGGTMHNNLFYGYGPAYYESGNINIIGSSVHRKTRYLGLTPIRYYYSYNYRKEAQYPDPSYYIVKYFHTTKYLYPPSDNTIFFDTSKIDIIEQEPWGDPNSTVWGPKWLSFFAIFDTNFVPGVGTYDDSCLAPTGLHLEGIDETGVTLAWNSGGETMWDLVIAPEGTNLNDGMLTNTAINFLIIDSLEPGHWYTVQVRALCDTDVFGPWSEPIQFWYGDPEDSITCPTPVGLQVKSTGVGKVVLQWANNTEMEGWELEMGTEGTPVGSGMVSAAPMYFAVREGLDTATWHWARVRAKCGPDWYSLWSDTVMFYIPGDGSGPDNPDTNINDTTTAINYVELYTYLMPNPAREEVAVMSSFKVRSVELYASDGKLLKEQEVNGLGTRLSLEGLPAGVYFVRVRTSAGVTTKRLVVE